MIASIVASQHPTIPALDDSAFLNGQVGSYFPSSGQMTCHAFVMYFYMTNLYVLYLCVYVYMFVMNLCVYVFLLYLCVRLYLCLCSSCVCICMCVSTCACLAVVLQLCEYVKVSQDLEYLIFFLKKLLWGPMKVKFRHLWPRWS